MQNPTKKNNLLQSSQLPQEASQDWRDHVFEIPVQPVFGGPGSAFEKFKDKSSSKSFPTQTEVPNSNANPRLPENQSNNAFALVDYSFSKKGNSKD